LVDSLELQANDILALHSVVRDKLPLVLEVNRASDILQALRLKAKFKLNLVLLSAEEAPLVLDEIIKADVPIIIDPMDNIPDSFDELASNIELGGILDQAGINLMFSTQRSHNYHLMRQGAGNAVAYGMSYGTAIQGMTKNVADTFGLSGRGLIAEGNYADIVVWDQDPLEPSSFPKYVLINGKIQDLTTRSSRLTDRYKSSSDKPSAYKY
jgi:imidazolonepropionase-like amidohydrolase